MQSFSRKSCALADCHLPKQVSKLEWHWAHNQQQACVHSLGRCPMPREAVTLHLFLWAYMFDLDVLCFRYTAPFAEVWDCTWPHPVGKCLHANRSQMKRGFPPAVEACLLECLCLSWHSSLTTGRIFLPAVQWFKIQTLLEWLPAKYSHPKVQPGWNGAHYSGGCREWTARCEAGGVKDSSQPLCLRRILI